MNDQHQGQYQPFQQPAPNAYFDQYGILRNHQGFNQPQIQQPQAPPKKAGFIYRPVGGIEEARAAPIEWDGSVYFFEDKASGKIYRKQYVNDMVSFTAFGAIEMPEPIQTEYVTAETVGSLTQTVTELAAKLEALEKQMQPNVNPNVNPMTWKGAVRNNE